VAIDEPDRQRVLERLAPLVAAFPNFHPDPATFEAYVLVLVDVDPLLLEAAILQLISRPLEFMPSPGRIREEALDLMDGRLSGPDAWALVAQELRRGVGHFTGPVVAYVPGSDQPVTSYGEEPRVPPDVQRAVDAVGGWSRLRSSDNYSADRARFLEAYAVYADRSRNDARMLPAVRQVVSALAGRMQSPALLPKEAPLARRSLDSS